LPKILPTKQGPPLADSFVGLSAKTPARLNFKLTD
jgi:hypothetical protein